MRWSLLLVMLLVGMLPVVAAEPAPAPVSLELRDAGLPEALALLFKDSGKSYVIESGAQGRVTVSLTEATWEKALHAVVSGANMTYTRGDDGVYHITPPAPKQQAVTPAPLQPAPVPSVVTPGRSIRKYQVIKVKHVDVGAIARVFGGSTVNLYPSAPGWGQPYPGGSMPGAPATTGMPFSQPFGMQPGGMPNPAGSYPGQSARSPFPGTQPWSGTSTPWGR